MIDEPQPQPEAVAEALEPGRRILIVDDDELATSVLAGCLERVGFDVLTANSGRHGLALARVDRPDVILLDLGLPDIDGLDVCADLADDRETCEIPVIIITARESEDVVRASRTAGCRYFVHKPFDPNALLTLIQSAADACSW